MPKQWWLITLYMIFAYCILIGVIQYAKKHPIIDDRLETPTSESLQNDRKP